MKKFSRIDRTAIAKELNISPAYVSMILSGKRKAKKYKKFIESIKKQNPKSS